MRSVGEVMAIGRTFKEAYLKALRSMESSALLLRGAGTAGGPGSAGPSAPRGGARAPPGAAGGAVPSLPRGDDGRRGVHSSVGHRPLVPTAASKNLVEEATAAAAVDEARPIWTTPGSCARPRRTASRTGRWPRSSAPTEAEVRAHRTGARHSTGLQAGGHLRRGVRGLHPLPLFLATSEEDEAPPTDRKKVLILGSGPIRIGQGIEFDYCCVHAAFALRAAGYETVMVNCNPETVSTDYDTSDRLYFEPLTLEDVLEIAAPGEAARGHRPVRRADAAAALGAAGEGAGLPHPRDHARRHRPRRGPRALLPADREAGLASSRRTGSPGAPRRRFRPPSESATR